LVFDFEINDLRANRMGGFFSSPAPAVPEPTPAPTKEDPAVAEAAQAEQVRNRKARGFASTILTDGDTQDTQPLTVAARLIAGGARDTLGA